LNLFRYAIARQLLVMHSNPHKSIMGNNTSLNFIIESKGPFDFLKIKGQDRTISVVQCLICKTVSGTG